jgi:hypothetical protein
MAAKARIRKEAIDWEGTKECFMEVLLNERDLKAGG